MKVYGIGMMVLLIGAAELVAIDVSVLNRRLREEGVVTISGENLRVVAGPEGAKGIFVPSGSRLILNSSRLDLSELEGGLGIQGELVLNSSTLASSVEIVSGTIRYQGPNNKIEIVGEESDLTIKEQGRITDDSGVAQSSIEIIGQGASVSIQGFGSEIALSPGSHLEVSGKDGVRGTLDVRDGAHLSSSAQLVENDRVGADVVVRSSDMTIATSGTVDLQAGQLLVVGNPDGGEGGMFHVASASEVKLNGSTFVATQAANVTVDGSLELNGGLVIVSGNSPFNVGASGMVLHVNEALAAVFQSPMMVAGFLSYFNSSLVLSNDSLLNILSSGTVSSSVTSLVNRRSGQAEFPSTTEGVIQLGQDLLDGAQRLSLDAVFEELDSIDTFQTVFEDNLLPGASPPHSMVIEDSDVVFLEESVFDANAVGPRMENGAGGRLSIGTFTVLGGRSAITGKGAIDVNGVLLVDRGGTLHNTGKIQLGGNPFLRNFPKQITVRGALRNEGEVQNVGGVVEVIEGAILSGEPIVNSEEGRLTSEVLDPFPAVLTRMQISRAGDEVTVVWTPEGGRLEVAADIGGPYGVVDGATSPFTVRVSEPFRFFRIR